MDDNYTCPCCGFSTRFKNDMRRHLYGKKKPCPLKEKAAQDANLVLTDELKEFILANRVYHIPKPQVKSSKTIVNQTVNNFNQMNNYLNSNTHVMDRLNQYINYRNVDMIDFTEKVEDVYSNQIQMLDDDVDDFKLDACDILHMINTLCKTSDKSCDDMNVVFDEFANNISIYNDGKWKETGVEKGLLQIIDLLKEAYLDKYECYLLRRIYKGPFQSRKEAEETLHEYYQFIGCFGIQPYAVNKNDHILLDNDRYRSFEVSDKYYNTYKNVVLKLTKGEKNMIKAKVQRILKNAAKYNIKELNRRIMELCGVDEEFKIRVIDNISHVLAG